MINKNTRNSSIELLRIFTMIGVIILHYNNESMGGALKYASKGDANYYLLVFFECLCICAVNIFILITGYFLCNNYKRSFIKPIQLILEVILINEALYIFSAILNEGSLSIKSLFYNLLPHNWFVFLYCVVYLISPYMNIIVDKLKFKKLKGFILLLFIIFSVYSYLVEFAGEIFDFSPVGLSSVSMQGSISGYTIVNFVLMYFLGAYIRKIDFSIKTYKLFFLLLLDIIIIFISYLIAPKSATSYCSPFIVLEAVIIFLIFKNIKINSNKIINFLAQGAFTVFLTHFSFLPYIKIYKFVNENIFILFLHILISSFAIYLCGWVIFVIYDSITKPVFNLVNKKIKWLTFDISK